MRTRRRHRRQLRFTPTAWAKLRYLRDAGETEVGGFGISSASDLLLVEDFALVGQSCTPATVQLDDMAVAEYFERQVDLGRKPEQFARIWIHTHPGSCPLPSGTDEETFDRCFTAPDWAVMFILARGGATFARLRFNVGPGANKLLDIDVDYASGFSATDHDAWQRQYENSVEIEDPFASRIGSSGWDSWGLSGRWPAADWPIAADEPEQFKGVNEFEGVTS